MRLSHSRDLGPGSSVTKRARMEADLRYHWTISTPFALSRQASVSALGTRAGGQEQHSQTRAELGQLLSLTLTLLGLHCRLVVGWRVSHAVSPFRWPRQRTIRPRLFRELTF